MGLEPTTAGMYKWEVRYMGGLVVGMWGQQIPWLAKDLLQTDKELVEALLANEKDLDGSDGGQKKYRPTRNSEGIYKIMDGLYISGIEGAKDYMTLQRARVTHILNMAGPSVYDHHRAGGREKSYFPQLFVYKIITSYDKPEQDLLQYFPETSLFIQKGRMSGGILVHCHAGVSRSVAVIMAYMIDTLKLDAVTAFDVLKRGRPQAHPNVGFQKQIKQYEAMHVGGGGAHADAANSNAAHTNGTSANDGRCE